MRFQKGCIEINTIKDVPLLRQVLHCQLVTHEQLWRFMRLGLYEFQRSSFNWRVRRLVESGLLETQFTSLGTPSGALCRARKRPSTPKFCVPR